MRYQDLTRTSEFADLPTKVLCKAFEFCNQGRHQRAAALFDTTAGVIFLGTPHRGSNKATWATVARSLSEAVLHDHDPRIVEALIRGSEVLERLQDCFSGLLHGISVYCLFETLPVSVVGKVSTASKATTSPRI